MYSKEVKIVNQSGLHARPASEFVSLSNKFQSEISIYRSSNPNQCVNAKSIVFILSLGLVSNTLVTISANGEDEVNAVDSLVALINSGFGEL